MAVQRYWGSGMQPDDAGGAPWANVYEMLRSQYEAMAAAGPQQGAGEAPPMPVLHYQSGRQVQASQGAGLASRVSVPMGYSGQSGSSPAYGQPTSNGGVSNTPRQAGTYRPSGPGSA